MSEFIKVTDVQSFLATSAEEKILIFSLDKCAPCEALLEAVTELETTGYLSATVINVIKLADDASKPEIMAAFGLKFFPTLYLFQNGEHIGTMQGFPDYGKEAAPQLRKWVERKRLKTKPQQLARRTS